MGLCQALGNISRLLIVGATVIALILSILTAMSCELVQVDEASGSTWGFFFRGANGTCQDMVFGTEDEMILAGRTCLIVSICAGFIAGVMVTFEWLFCEICCAGVLEGIAFFLAWAVGAISFMFYGSDLCTADGKECTFYDASGYMTAAVILYLGCGVVLCFAPQPYPICRSSKE
ncbi:expressed unknown protein [Seminavis robusta]|uniref:Uncharacterized protein n=1 Tax=Seminavis robusta TaxID=568900 RepID=A0A9N8DFA3_9STRA|nr:expressed unknown protein [Seminavis robusta]|eukprot:Sro122_g059120.1 n/a (175) ;mRNA; f:24575-25191